MADKSWKSKIIDMYKSEEYINLLGYYRKQGLLQIMKNARDENDHSDFIAWLLDSESDHGMGKEPAEYFLRLLMERHLESKDSENECLETFDNKYSDEILFGKWIVETSECKTQQAVSYTDPITKKIKNNYIDILIEISLVDSDENRKILPIIIENKIDAVIHDSNTDKGKMPQTKAYYNWAIEKKYVDCEKYIRPIFVLLSPSKEDDKIKAEHYRKIDYQDFMDYVLEPIMIIGEDARIKQYVRSLSGLGINGQYIEYLRIKNKKSLRGILAQSKEEKMLLRNFLRTNIDLIKTAAEKSGYKELSNELKKMKTNNVL